MKVRFQADADLNQRIVLAVLRREPALDFQTAPAAGLAGLADPRVLGICSEEGRVLVTHDCSTMPGHFADFIQHAASAGVVLVPQHIPLSPIVEDLLLIWLSSEAEEWMNRICWLPL